MVIGTCYYQSLDLVVLSDEKIMKTIILAGCLVLLMLLLLSCDDNGSAIKMLLFATAVILVIHEFLWHTADDQAVPVENSLMFSAALRENEILFELHVFPHGAHGLGLAMGQPNIAVWPELCLAWLKNIGW